MHEITYQAFRDFGGGCLVDDVPACVSHGSLTTREEPPQPWNVTYLSVNSSCSQPAAGMCRLLYFLDSLFLLLHPDTRSVWMPRLRLDLFPPGSKFCTEGTAGTGTGLWVPARPSGSGLVLDWNWLDLRVLA